MRDDIYNRIPLLPTEDVVELEEFYRSFVEKQDLPQRHKRFYKLWLRCHFELENRKEKEKYET